MAFPDPLIRRAFLGGLAALLAVVAGVAAAADGTHFVWFGTYTGGNAGSQGIYVSRFDAAQGTLSAPVLAAAATNPSFLALHPTRPWLYAVAESSGGSGESAGAIVAFAIDEATGSLRRLNEQPSGGAGPCHLCVDPAGKVVVATNYGGGSTTCLGIGADGRLEPVTVGAAGGFVQHLFDRAADKGIHPQRQEKPHAHGAAVTPDGRFAFVCDLGLDQVIISALDVDKATLAPHSVARVANGAGPRHIALDPRGRFAYCLNELDHTVTAFAFDPAAGTLAPIQSLSTLPESVADPTGVLCAEIAVHPSGRFVYASNRGHDSITVYTVDEATGRLTFRGFEPIRGQTPRHFALAPDGRFLLAEGQGSNTVAIFSIDPTTGMLRFLDRSITVPAPVSAVFRPID